VPLGWALVLPKFFLTRVRVGLDWFFMVLGLVAVLLFSWLLLRAG